YTKYISLHRNLRTILMPLHNAHLTHLHSFPTRRSSDLRGRGHARPGAPCQPVGPMVPPAVRMRARAGEPRIRQRVAQAAGMKGRDRKSTRLNSSHVKISYAVFCLKKKKK